MVTSSKTIIVDPFPITLKVLSGRQTGVMRKFIGLYVFLPRQTFGQNNMFFMGYAKIISGFDLSPNMMNLQNMFNWWNWFSGWNTNYE
jgi:hypothetical protein